MNFSKSDEIFRMLDWDVGLFYNRTCTKDRMYFFQDYLESYQNIWRYKLWHRSVKIQQLVKR